MKQIAGELARLDVEFLARVAIDHLDAYAGVADALAQLRSQIPLYLLAGNLPDSGQQRADLQPRTRLRRQNLPSSDLIAGIALAHVHFVHGAVAAASAHRQRFTHGPEREQADAEFALDAL